MATFGVRLENNESFNQAIKFLEDTNKRISENNLIKNPFTGTIKRIGDIFLVDLKPIYFNFTPFFIFPIIGLYLFMGFTWIMIFPASLCLLSIFWTKYFFYFFFKIGVKKAGYKGKVKLLKDSETLRGVLYGTN